jgi:hypothetical protein
VLNSPPSTLRPAAAVLGFGSLALVALLVALLVGLGDARADTRADSAARGEGQVAGAAAKRPRAVAACSRYRRAKRHLQRVRRSFAARAARTYPRSRRAKLRRAHRVRTARRVARLRRLRRTCVRARRMGPDTRRFVAPAPGQGVSRPGGVRWGLHANRWGRGPEGPGELDHMQAMGVRWIREEFDSVPNEESDTLYANAARRGLRILPLLQKSSALPADVNEYANVVAAFARRYGPGGDFWGAHPELDSTMASTHFEVYNEPYGDWYGPVEPARFASLLRTVVPRARQANPQAKFLIPVDRTPGGERHTWIDDLYRADPALNELFDGVAIHPYSGSRAPDEPNDPWGFVRIADARNVLQSHGAGDKEFWITEVGWSTCPGDPEWCVSETQQAANMERLAELVRTRYTFVDAVFFYHFIGTERDPNNSEDFFGLVHVDFSPKPGFHALRRIAAAG